MEGLIPLVYKKVKNCSTGRKYKRLASETAASGSNFDTADFHAHHYAASPSGNLPGNHRRRSSSVGEYSTGKFAAPGDDVAAKKGNKRTVRSRSVRFLSCASGAIDY